MLLNAAFLNPLGQVFMEKNPGKDLPYGPGWGAIFGSVDARTGCTDPGTGYIQ
jgi:hypothetical protein